jgi:hypothetical protein
MASVYRGFSPKRPSFAMLRDWLIGDTNGL